MNKKTARWLLSSGCVLVVGWFLITLWVHGDSGRESGTADPFGAVKEEPPRERPNALGPTGRKAIRPRAPLGAGWRELPIEKAIIHSLGGVGSGDRVWFNGSFNPCAIQLKYGQLEKVICFESLKVLALNRLENALKKCVGITPEEYVSNNGDVIVRVGDLEVRLLNEWEIIGRSFRRDIAPEDEGPIILPEYATIGKPFQPSNRDEGVDRNMLARWFRDTWRHQRSLRIPKAKANSPFCIFSSTFRGGACITDHHGYVEVQSLRIRGNRIVLKVAFSDPNVTRNRRSREWWLPLVEVPISDGLPVGRYSVQVDWEGEEEIQPGGSHIFTFEVIK